jgi:thioredoxin reductase
MIDGHPREFDQVIAMTKVTARDGIADSLGCRRNHKGQVEIGDAGETCTPDVYAVGDQSEEAGQVNIAVSVGHKAGIAINLELIRRRHADAELKAAAAGSDAG